MRGAKENKDLWYCGFCGNSYNIWNSTKAVMHLTRSCGHSISRCRGDILPKYQRQFRSLKEKKEFFINQRVSNNYLLQTSVHSGAEAISIYFLSSKIRKVYGTSSAESNWVGYLVENNIER